MTYDEVYAQAFALVRERQYRRAVRACEQFATSAEQAQDIGRALAMKASVLLRAGAEALEVWHWIGEAAPFLRRHHADLGRLYIVALSAAGQYADEPKAAVYAAKVQTLYPKRPPVALRGRLYACLSVIPRGRCDWAASRELLETAYRTLRGQRDADGATARETVALWTAWTCAQEKDGAGLERWLRVAGRGRSSRCNADLTAALVAERLMLIGALDRAQDGLDRVAGGPPDKGTIAILYARVKLAILQGGGWEEPARNALTQMTTRHHQWAVEPVRELIRSSRREATAHVRLA